MDGEGISRDPRIQEQARVGHWQQAAICRGASDRSHTRTRGDTDPTSAAKSAHRSIQATVAKFATRWPFRIHRSRRFDRPAFKRDGAVFGGLPPHETGAFARFVADPRGAEGHSSLPVQGHCLVVSTTRVSARVSVAISRGIGDGRVTPYRDADELFARALELHDTRRLLHRPSLWVEHDEQMVMPRGEPIEGPVRTDRFPPQTEIMDALSTLDPCVDVTIMASAQISKTFSALCAIGERIDEHPTHILYVISKDKKIGDFQAKKWQPFAASSSRLRARLGQPGHADNKLVMTFDGGSLTFAGASSPESFREDSYEIVVLDDYDAMPVNTNKEGDLVVLAHGRIAMYRLKSPKVVTISSPVLVDGPTDKRWKASSMERWYMPCLSCGYMQTLELPMLVWTPGQPATAHFLCSGPDCGQAIHQYQIKAMLARGHWRALHPERKPYHRGFYMGQAIAPLEFARWSDYVRAHEEAEAEYLDTGSEQKRMAVRNLRAGLPYESVSNAKLDEIAQIAVSRSEQPWTLAELPIEIMSAGVDLGGHGIATTILGTGPNYERWILEYHNVAGNIRHNSTWDAWLKWLLDHPLLATRSLHAICIDASWEQTEICSRFELLAFPLGGKRIYAWPVKGQEGEGNLWPGPIEWGNPATSGYSPVRIAVDQAKSQIYDSLAKPAKSGPGVLHFTVDRRPSYFRGLFSERRVRPEDKAGPRRQWIPRSARVRREPLDTLVYAIAACEGLCARHEGVRAALMRGETLTAAAASRQPVRGPTRSAPISRAGYGDPNDLGVL
jgi:phage terminase large subunit GpA-like protein